MNTSPSLPPVSASPQGVARIAALLRLVAVHQGSGLRYTEIAELSGLERPTAHRVLKSMVEEELLVRDPATRRYRLGALIAELGALAAPVHDLGALCQPALQRLAQATGDTAFVFTRRANDALCVSRVQGDFPIQTPVVAVGSRQPLGVNAGGLAFLMALPAREVDSILAAVGSRLGSFQQLEVNKLREAVAAARKQGYACIGEHAVAGVTAIGLPVPGAGGAPVAALTVASTTSRMTLERQQDILPVLRREVHALAALLGGDGATQYKTGQHP
ncbi:IclR family transcriptional regulator [Comamonas endophytica]|uniref:IclR family transcriptional regulator n=1 Tax=Comamonas endophytica TaxID=2949090 RepID=A0ABY6GC64_9BURK|nr:MULTISPECIES: IclR family transcriptional regulator [unclassified Acidovorax]MCD2513011.1 IclR family transcriptional regulator [Acidovorax sp. D4N7]UYG52648.1 IclR family transcriptional regulator [Acidovorax sp. 5MLIR]